MAISFGGLGNGVDFGQVVSELAKVQRLPIDALTAKKKDLQTKLTDYGALGQQAARASERRECPPASQQLQSI
jgi:flagellar hook-associated protein 2